MWRLFPFTLPQHALGYFVTLFNYCGPFLGFSFFRENSISPRGSRPPIWPHSTLLSFFTIPLSSIFRTWTLDTNVRGNSKNFPFIIHFCKRSTCAYKAYISSTICYSNPTCSVSPGSPFLFYKPACKRRIYYQTHIGT